MPEENKIFLIDIPMITHLEWEHHKQVVWILEKELTDS